MFSDDREDHVETPPSRLATVMVVAVCFLSSITASSITLVLTWITTSHGAQSLLILTGMESGESV